jgi:glycosyltransferase involved in cell wall biosynthesis
MASWITGVPLVGTLVNDSYSPMAWKDKQGLKYRLVYWLDRLTAGIPIHWIANAHALAESHVKTLGIKRERISVVYRGRPVIAREARPKQSLFENENSMKDRFVPRDDESPVIARTRHSLPHTNVGEDEAISSDNQISSNEETASSAESIALKSEFTDSRLPPQRAGAVTWSVRNFISYGRLLERKGFQEAIRAFSQVVTNYPDCTLTIFGEGPYRTELESLIHDLGLEGSVFLPGKVQNPVDLLNSDLREHRTSFHCFLFPSWYEGFSGALVEAMMAGIPIIASDIPMNLEAIEADKSALVFPVGNVAALADQLLFAIQNSERMEELGKEARKVAIQNFDIEVIAKEYEEVLGGILPHPDPSQEGRESGSNEVNF